jgi:hypothetical protein
MINDFKPWEWVSKTENGSYILVRADDKTRQKQLEEYKKKRRKEIEKELKALDSLY